MRLKGMRGITVIRRVEVTKTKSETIYKNRPFRVHCNAAIPFSHKDFKDYSYFDC